MNSKMVVVVVVVVPSLKIAKMRAMLLGLVRSSVFFQRVGLFYLQVSFFTYGWSLLLTVNWLGLFYLRLKFGLVFFCLW